MPRPRKQTVDFFPHFCVHGKTMYILEQRFGNDGYAFFFKLLEELGSANGHYLDLSDDTELEFFGAKTRVSVEKTIDIVDLLARMNVIDKALWEKRIIWSQRFVDDLKAVYDKRAISVPEKPVFGTETQVSGGDNPHSIVEYSKDNTANADFHLKEKNMDTIYLDEFGEVMGKDDSATPKKYAGKKKLFSKIAIYYMKLLNKNGNVLRYFPAVKELFELYTKEFPKDSMEQIEKELIARIDVAYWHYTKQLKFSDWGLAKVAENWEHIMDWNKEKKKSQ